MRTSIVVAFFGAVLMSSPASSRRGRCPSDMVVAKEGVCIDRFEWPNRAGTRPLVGASAVAEPEDALAGRVMDAEQLCAGVGKRVCMASEWIAACKGPEGTRYPFGNSLPKYTPGVGGGLCNYDKRYRDVDEYLVMKRDVHEMNRLDQSEPAGARETCRSPVGAYDMVGNAEEWVRCSHSKSQWGWCLVGRYWSEPRPCGQVVATHAPNWHFYNTSFRCCRDMEE